MYDIFPKSEPICHNNSWIMPEDLFGRLPGVGRTPGWHMLSWGVYVEKERSYTLDFHFSTERSPWMYMYMNLLTRLYYHMMYSVIPSYLADVLRRHPAPLALAVANSPTSYVVFINSPFQHRQLANVICSVTGASRVIWSSCSSKVLCNYIINWLVLGFHMLMYIDVTIFRYYESELHFRVLDRRRNGFIVNHFVIRGCWGKMLNNDSRDNQIDY